MNESYYFSRKCLIVSNMFFVSLFSLPLTKQIMIMSPLKCRKIYYQINFLVREGKPARAGLELTVIEFAWGVWIIAFASKLSYSGVYDKWDIVLNSCISGFNTTALHCGYANSINCISLLNLRGKHALSQIELGEKLFQLSKTNWSGFFLHGKWSISKSNV